jgi:hypothetical protein
MKIEINIETNSTISKIYFVTDFYFGENLIYFINYNDESEPEVCCPFADNSTINKTRIRNMYK